MNGTPRGVNRVLLALIGLVFLAAGGLMVAVAAAPAFAAAWRHQAGHWIQDLRAAAGATGVRGGPSWIWLVVAGVLVLLIIAMIAWLAAQGRGRTALLVDSYRMDTGSGVAGRVVLQASVAEQAVRNALANRTDLLSATISTYEFRGQAGLKIRLVPRQGASPEVLAAEVSALVEALEALTGHAVPVVLSLASGARARLTKKERVR
jgi:hypothetical protein